MTLPFSVSLKRTDMNNKNKLYVRCLKANRKGYCLLITVNIFHLQTINPFRLKFLFRFTKRFSADKI